MEKPVPTSKSKPAPWRFGAAGVDITPATPQYLTGYFRPEPSDGVYHPLHAKALYMTDGESEAAIIAADLCIFSADITARFRQAISSASGVPAENIVLCATHTHTGPRITDPAPNDASGHADPAYVDSLENSLADAVRAAKDRARPGRVEFSRVRSHLGVNRRQMRDGKAAFLPNPEGAHDRAVDTRWILNAQGRLIATLTSYGCHPTIMGGQEIGADYPGYFGDLMEERTGAPALWCCGCGANIRPWFSGRIDSWAGESVPASARKMSFAHAQEILAGRKQAFPIELGRLKVARRMVALPIQKPWTLKQVRAMQYDKMIAAFGRKFPQIVAQMQKRRSAPCEVQVLSLDNGHHLAYLGGEICTELGIALKDMCPGQIVTPHGFANSAVGYVAAEHMLPQGGHEVDGNCFFYGLPARLVPNAQDYLLRAALSMIDDAAVSF